MEGVAIPQVGDVRDRHSRCDGGDANLMPTGAELATTWPRCRRSRQRVRRRCAANAPSERPQAAVLSAASSSRCSREVSRDAAASSNRWKSDGTTSQRGASWTVGVSEVWTMRVARPSVSRRCSNTVGPSPRAVAMKRLCTAQPRLRQLASLGSGQPLGPPLGLPQRVGRGGGRWLAGPRSGRRPRSYS